MKEIRFWDNPAKICTVMLVILMLVLTSACRTGDRSDPDLKSAAMNEEQAFVRVVYAIPDRVGDVYADDKKEFSSIDYRTVTDYKQVSEDRGTFSVKLSDRENSEPIAKASRGLDSEGHYTLVVFPNKDDNAVTLKVIEDNATAPTSGKAKVRIINASYRAGELNIYIEGKKEAFVSNINPQEESVYKEINPTRTILEVRSNNEQRPAMTIDSIFQSGKAYTVVILGRTSEYPRLEAVVLTDKLKDETGAKTTVSRK
jgi:hypothetical protein